MAGEASQGTPREPATPKYLQIAGRYARAIEAGTLRPGDRLPSVRRLHAEERVSISTVMQALARLEAQGLVEARPKSGYFVRARVRAPPPQPARPARRAPSAVGVSALVARVYRAAGDPRVVQLGAAIPTSALLPARELARAIAAEARAHPEAQVDYQMPPGLPELRHQVARRALEWGCTLAADDLVITGGATEAVTLALLAVAAPGAVVAVESPTFYGTLKAIEALGLKALEIPCHPEDGMDLDELEARLDRYKVAAVVSVPNFNNPLGSCMPDLAKARLVEMLAARRIPLVEDDIFGDLAFGPVRPRAAKSWDRDGGVILCGSLSKSLAPGLRVGWAAPGRFRERFEHLKFALNMAAPTLPQRVIARVLREGGYDRHLRTLRARLREIVERVSAAVAESFPPGTRVSRPLGGCFLWVVLPGQVDTLELFTRALDAGVSIAPGAIFSPSQAHRSCIRLGCIEPWSERLDAGVRLVGRLAGRLEG
ncbi:MAG: PLP-dependent aminotransferase family protein [Deltaproteobacteria bacterium]|nr:PLP-dependent aminotransferase family protein [Deltaproteobacteria bacterium]